ncbi:hypothetical protein B484DRAFT_469015, partial [Ochromonadaceae sp. CCMP2298]
MSSLAAICSQNPPCDAYLKTLVVKLGTIPTDASTAEFHVLKAAEAVVKTVIFLPFLADAAIDAPAPPSTALLRGADALWLRVTGRSVEDDPATFTLVCDIVGGQQTSETHVPAGQCGITLDGVTQVLALTPCGIQGAVRAKVIDLGPRADDLPSGTSAPAVSSSSSSTATKGWDLDGNSWDCLAKSQIFERMHKIQPLTRMWSRAKVLAYAPDILLQGKWLQRSCDKFRTSTAAPPADHIDSGHQHFMRIAHLPVLADGFGPDSRLERALGLQLESLDYEQLYIGDFGIGLGAGSFKADNTKEPRDSLATCLDNFQQFWRVFSCPEFGSSLQPLINSLRDDFNVWSRMQNNYLLYRVSLMLHSWAEDVARQVKSVKFPDREFKDGPGCAGLLGDYGRDFVSNGSKAASGADNWSQDGHFYFNQQPDGLAHLMKFRSSKRKAAPGLAEEGDKDGDKEKGGDKGKGDKEKERVKAAEEKNKLRQQRGCAYCVLKQLDVRNSAGEPFECRGSEFLTHIPDVKTISKAYALQCVKGGVKSADLLK